MPMKSQAQRAYLHIHHPEMADRWEKETPKGKLPEHVGGTMKPKAHPGFKNVQNSIAKKEGVSKESAGAILANATRKASPAAKKKNPRLLRVKYNPKD